MSVRVLVCDDHPLARMTYRLLLTANAGFEVAGEAPDGEQAVDLARRLRPDVVLMDIRMPRLDGVEATRHITRAGPDAPRVLIMTTFDLDEYVYRALRARASGFLLKEATPEQLLEALRVVATGDALLAPSVTRRLLDTVAPTLPTAPDGADPLAGLTGRERETLVLVARGLSNQEIARTLFLAEGTVRVYVSRLLAKLDARDRIHLVILAYEVGLVRPGRD